MLRISLYWVQMQENVDQNTDTDNSEYGYTFNTVFATVFFEPENSWKHSPEKKIPDTCWKGNFL